MKQKQKLYNMIEKNSINSKETFLLTVYLLIFMQSYVLAICGSTMNTKRQHKQQHLLVRIISTKHLFYMPLSPHSYRLFHIFTYRSKTKLVDCIIRNNSEW